MVVVIVGAGALGSQVGAALVGAGHQVTLLDRDAHVVAGLGEKLRGARTIVADGCDAGALEAAGALRADVLVATTGSDDDNLVVALLAKRRCQVPQVVARVNEPDAAWLFDSSWGVDVAVSPADTMVSLIEEATRTTPTVDLLRLRRAGLELLETTLTEGSAAAGRTVAELELPEGTVVACVVRDGHPLRAGRRLRLEPGDQVLVLSSNPSSSIETVFQNGARG